MLLEAYLITTSISMLINGKYSLYVKNKIEKGDKDIYRQMENWSTLNKVSYWTKPVLKTLFPVYNIIHSLKNLSKGKRYLNTIWTNKFTKKNNKIISKKRKKQKQEKEYHNDSLKSTLPKNNNLHYDNKSVNPNNSKISRKTDEDKIIKLKKKCSELYKKQEIMKKTNAPTSERLKCLKELQVCINELKELIEINENKNIQNNNSNIILKQKM